jgi:hypothetical protein
MSAQHATTPAPAHGGKIRHDAVTFCKEIYPGAKLCPVNFNPCGTYSDPDTGIEAVFVTLLPDGPDTPADSISAMKGNWSATFPPLAEGVYSLTVQGTVSQPAPVWPLYFYNKFCQVNLSRPKGGSAKAGAVK